MSEVTEVKKKESPCSYWCFTLNNHTDEDIFYLENILKHECKWYLFQEEMGEEGTIHLQGTISLINKKRFNSVKRLHEKAHWERTRSIKNSIEYCQKKKTRVGRMFCSGIEIDEEIRVHEPYGWQLDVMDIIKEEPDERTIHWFWEPHGNVGKSSLTKYLVHKHDAIKVSGKGNDIAHIISKHKNVKIVICDIPRVTLGHVNIGTLEEVKNGLLFSGKYDSCQVIFNCPHVICFANEPPNIESMSKDRWNIVRIENIQGVSNVPSVPFVPNVPDGGNTSSPSGILDMY